MSSEGKKISKTAPVLEAKGAATALAADGVVEEKKPVGSQEIGDKFDSEEKKAKVEKIKKEYGEEIKEAIKESYGKLKEKMEWALAAKESAERKRLIESKRINYVDLVKEIDEFSSSIEKIEESLEKIFPDIAAEIADMELAGKKIKYTQFAQNAIFKRYCRSKKEVVGSKGELGEFLYLYKELRKIEKGREDIGKSGSEAGEAAEEMKPPETDIEKKLFEKAGIQEAAEKLRKGYDSLSTNQRKIVDYKRGILRKVDMTLRDIAELPKGHPEYFRDEWLIKVLNIYRDTIKSIYDLGKKAEFDAQFPSFVEETARKSGFDDKGVELLAKFYKEAIKIEDLLAKN